MSLIIHSARIVDSGVDVTDGWIRVDNGVVTERGTGASWTAATDDRVVDATEVAGEGAIVTPGFIDLHCHGGDGAAFDNGISDITRAKALHRSHGTTRLVISLVTAPVEVLAERVRTIAALANEDDTILGSHLEGPFLAASHKGAHAEDLLVDPQGADVSALITAGAGTIRQVTIAPERAGSTAAIEAFLAAGVVVAVGHTGADAALTNATFDAGARLLTHAFNGMRSIHHREPGPVGAALADDRVVLEVIADGIHVDLDLIAVVFRAAKGRVALITDAMAAAGSSDGDYLLGELAVTVKDGVARLQDGGSIAGSTLLLDRAVRNVVSAGVSLVDAVDAVTRTPARVLKEDGLGHLQPGGTADALILTRDLHVSRVFIAGVETVA